MHFGECLFGSIAYRARTGVITICSLLEMVLTSISDLLNTLSYSMISVSARQLNNMMFTSMILLSKYCTRSCRDIMVNKMLHYR